MEDPKGAGVSESDVANSDGDGVGPGVVRLCVRPPAGDNKRQCWSGLLWRDAVDSSVEQTCVGRGGARRWRRALRAGLTSWGGSLGVEATNSKSVRDSFGDAHSPKHYRAFGFGLGTYSIDNPA